MSSKAQITQKLLNEYPDWSDIRNDEQSLGAQFINTIGTQLEDLQEQLKVLGKNYYLTTANVKEIDVVYKTQLPLTKTFEVTNTDPNNPIYLPPTVSGLISNAWVTISGVNPNTIESFWYDQVPTRIDTVSYPINNIILDDASNNIYSGIASLIEANSPLIINSGIEIDFPKGQLWVETYGGQQYLNINDQGIPTRGSVTIKGLTTKGQEDSEKIIFIHDELQRSKKEWSNITHVFINDILTDQVKVRLLQHRFGRTQTPKLSPSTDFHNLYVSPGSKEDIDLFWNIGLNSVNAPILNLITWQVDELKSRISGFTGLQTLRSFELLDTNSNNIGNPIDVAVEPFSHRLWIADSNHLYIYNTDQHLPNMRALSKKDFDAMSVIAPSSYYITRSDSLQLSYEIKRPITDVIKHRVYGTDPNGTNFIIVNGVMSAGDINDSWVYGGNTDRILRQADIFNLTIRGEWLFNLDVQYTNGTMENDQRIIMVDFKTALASFPINSGIIEGLDFDSSQNLWVLINTAGTRSKLKVSAHYDYMLVDYDNKILIFKEPYEQVRIL